MQKAGATADGINCSLVIPVYRNEENIPSLLEALIALAGEIGTGFEVVFVVDGSPDNSYTMLAERLPAMPFQSQLVGLSRNFGAFPAIRTGLELARGRFFAVLAADLQEPPELITEFFRILRAGEADVAFGRRTGRADGWFTKSLSSAFWYVYRKLVIRDVPAGGVDVFACNEQVRGALLQIEETNSSLVAQLFWVGYRRAFVPYRRREREHGKSAWSFGKRFQYMLDSIFSFSDFPILALLWVGTIGCVVTLVLAVVIYLSWLLGVIEVPGYTPIMLVILFVGFTLLFTQGFIGCYLWRIAENTRRRPQSLVALSATYPARDSE